MPLSITRPFALFVTMVLVVAGVVLGAGPAAAAPTPPGTIVYIKNHNIWMAKGDGTGQVRITKDGTKNDPYSSPSQADDGTIVAAHTYLIVRFDPSGKKLGWFEPPALKSSAGAPLSGIPHYVSISPNGKTIAYTRLSSQSPLGTSSGIRYATGYTTPKGKAKANATYFRAPSWISNKRTLQSGGYGSHAMLHTLGSAPVNWFNDDDVYESVADLNDLEISRDGRWLIGLRGHGSSTQVVWYQLSGNVTTASHPALPTPKCDTSTDPNFASPTLAPNGSAAAWEESDGIWIKNGLDNCTSPQPTLRIPGGSEPSWSSYHYGSSATTLKATKAPTIKGKAKVGKKLTAKKGTWSPAPSSYDFQWKRNGKAIPGATKSTYRTVRADSGKKITVSVTAHRSGYAAVTKTSAKKGIAFANIKKPVVKGTAKVGKKLSASTGTWKGKPATFKYQWFRGTSKIAGAKKATYTLTAADRGATLRVKVVAKSKGIAKSPAFSRYTGKVK